MEKQVIIRRIIILCLLLALTITLLFGQFSLAEQVEKNLPNAFCLRSQDGLNLTFDDVNILGDNVVAVNSSSGIATSDYFESYGEPVNVLKTTIAYDSILPIEVLRGSFFVRTDTPLTSKAVVISQALATSFFKTDNVIGEEILIDGSAYEICGIYKGDTTLLAKLSGNGRESIFIPAISDEKYASLPIHSLYIKSDSSFSSVVVDNINQQIGRDPNPESISAYSDTNRIIGQADKATLFIGAVFIAAFLLYIAYKSSRTAIQECRTDRTHFVIHSVGAAVLGVVAIALLFLARFEFWLPADILPYDNIFDISYYLEKITYAVAEYNAFSGFEPLWLYSHLAMLACIVLSAIATISMTVTCVYGMIFCKGLIKSRL